MPGDPVSKGRPRHGQGRTYTPKRTLAAEAVVATLAKEWMGEDTPPADVPVGVALEFYCATRRRTDADNLAKLVTDALNRIVYTDDYLIEELLVRVYRGCGEQARSEVFIWQLDTSAPADAVEPRDPARSS